MSDIPEDIMQAAEACANVLCFSHIEAARQQAVVPIARAILAERERDRWLPIDSAPRDGTRFLAAEWDGQGWVIGPCLWCKTPHVPLYGFHFTEGDPENWDIANPKFWQPLPTIRSPERAGE